jgi:hypothetical protein
MKGLIWALCVAIFAGCALVSGAAARPQQARDVAAVTCRGHTVSRTLASRTCPAVGATEAAYPGDASVVSGVSVAGHG